MVFYGRLYNVTEGTIESSLTKYTIAEYVGPDDRIYWLENNTLNAQVGFESRDFSINHANNMARIFEQAAKYSFYTKGYWPLLRIVCGNKTSYYFEWTHDNPNSIYACIDENNKRELPHWMNWHQENLWDSNIFSYCFSSAHSYGDFFGTTRQLISGSVYYGIPFNEVNSSTVPYVDISICDTQVEYNSGCTFTEAQSVYGRTTSPLQDIVYFKENNGICATICIINRTESGHPNHSGFCSMNYTPTPSADSVIGTAPVIPKGSFNLVFRGRPFVTYLAFINDVNSYTSNCPVMDAEGHDFVINNQWDYWFYTKLFDTIAFVVTDSILSVYEVLTANVKPDEPDVDPDNPPDPTEPPDPITPDNPDPYYDPTSDPDSPDYDPKKDPDSPEYDPSEPSTPYRPPTTEGGGDPPVKPPEDPVTPPPTPPSHAINSRFVTLYTPSLSQLNALAAYLWSPAWSIDGFKKIFANPIDCILGLMIFPALTSPSGSKEVNVGNLSTGVTMSYIDNQYVELNCGSFEITEYYASYLDYDPYTKIEIYLPYIGTHRLSADDVMSKTIQLKYMIDLLSGACVAFLVVDGTTLYTFTGSCATPIPVSGNDWSNMVNGILSVAGAATAAVISGGTAATMAAGAVASTSLFVSSHKENIRHGGSVASAAGLMSIQTPYLIVTRPRQALPIGQNSFQGYPSFMTESLGSLSGYTEVESCHLEHVPCTDEELKEIERLLKGGVLF